MLSLILVSSAHASPFGPFEKEALQEAIAFWGEGWPSNCTEIRGEEKPSLELENLPKLGEASEPTSPVRCSILLVENLEPCVIRSVMIHEVGHLLGYPHSANPNFWMYPEVPMYFCIIPKLTTRIYHDDKLEKLHPYSSILKSDIRSLNRELKKDTFYSNHRD